ncbi:MAG: chromosomal replication initiator DnaA [Rhodospirillales bacterium]|nr:chromosomal replication initiator DnaA [Rhodospirillales bacterium]
MRAGRPAPSSGPWRGSSLGAGAVTRPAAGRQLALGLPATTSRARADFIEDASNREALAWLDRPENWPGGRFCVFGPPGIGKSHLLAAIATERGWALAEAATLRGLPEVSGTGLVLDDADCVGEEAALFHLINLCGERGVPLLMAGRAPPARWPVALPDLASRLRATAAAGIGAPSDELLAALLTKLFADRQVLVGAEVQTWLLRHLPRSAAALGEAVARIDRLALAEAAAVTRPLARRALTGWEGIFPADDGFEASTTGTSPHAPPLL